MARSEAVKDAVESVEIRMDELPLWSQFVTAPFGSPPVEAQQIWFLSQRRSDQTVHLLFN
jgi:hypothetical protein